MMTCTCCGVSVSGTSRFCSSCGSPLSAADGATMTVAESSPRPPLTGGTGSRSRINVSTAVDGRFPPGALLAERYRIVALLGRGGMGEVYRADDLTLGQTVALKFLPEAMSRNEAALARFYNEVRIARQVSHPNVCRVYDLGESEGQPYLSMEYVDGEDLGSLLRRIGRLPSDKATEIARRLCAGLAAAHDKGVLHRDLKPANVMLDARGQVLITDFGLAGIAEQIQGAEVRNGTPAYMAPEQLAGREVTQASDIYALGLVLYEIFTGKRAFRAETVADLVRLQAHARPESMTGIVRDLDPSVETVIERCLDPDPRNRPPSALAVAAALPGGDPLAMALAAGETPSPQMVAASGESTGLSLRPAIACFAAVLAGLLIMALLSSQMTLVNRAGLELPPDVLRIKAADLLKQIGYTSRPRDWAQGFDFAWDYLEYVKKHDKPKPNWDAIPTGRPSPVRYWYRTTQDELVARDWISNGSAAIGEVTQDDPPQTRPGMVTVKLDAQGWLVSLEAVPPEREPALDKPPVVDWNPLLRAAGLDPGQLTPAVPEWAAHSASDTRAAWTGTYPDAAKRPLRVEAASWRGKPVFFSALGPWSEPKPAESKPMTAGERANAFVWIGLMSAAFVWGAFFAWRNYTLGRADARGAFRLGLMMFAVEIALWVCGSHHIASLSLLITFVLALSHALFMAVCLAVLYLALEPIVRRRWPQTMVSWSRLLTGRIRDPLVGRDLLYGLVLAVIWAMLFEVRHFLVLRLGGPPDTTSTEYLGSAGQALGAWLMQIPGAVRGVLLFFFLLFALRTLLRRQWLAVLAFVSIFVLMRIGSDYPAVDIPIVAAVYAIAAIFLTRYGVLTLATGAFVVDVLATAPITMDSSAWYFNTSLAILLSFVALAVFAFHTALAGRPLLKEEWFN